ncbi:hypothetical protein [Cryptosporangium japonicum]|uniref:Ribosomal protein L7/L12 C-terminal domain-containing protein n=1 Tax=Cryptosporangium japonicum TaxID=80872 RepID=A0ABP3DXC8_9ACTN
MTDAVWVWVTLIVALGWVARILLIAYLDRTGEQRRIGRQVRSLERQVAQLNERLNIEPPAHPDLTDVLDHLRDGKKLLAVRDYRDITGVDFGAAKDAVEQLEREHGL